MPKAAGLGPRRESRNFWIKLSFLTPGCGGVMPRRPSGRGRGWRKGILGERSGKKCLDDVGNAVHAAPRPLPDKSGTEGVAGVEAGAPGGPMVPCIGGREGGSLARSG